MANAPKSLAEAIRQRRATPSFDGEPIPPGDLLGGWGELRQVDPEAIGLDFDDTADADVRERPVPKPRA